MSIQDNTGDSVGKGALGVLDVGEAGPLWLIWGARGLRSIRWEGPSEDAAAGLARTDVPAEYGDPLRAYFAGEAVDPASLPVELEGTPFQRRVWTALRGIPRGQVRTYGSIAQSIGSPRAMRAVGMANHRNPLPIVVPCHRVVEAGSQLGGYSGGLDRKRLLLTLEGVKVEGDRVLGGQMDLF